MNFSDNFEISYLKTQGCILIFSIFDCPKNLKFLIPFFEFLIILIASFFLVIQIRNFYLNFNNMLKIIIFSFCIVIYGLLRTLSLSFLFLEFNNLFYQTFYIYSIYSSNLVYLSFPFILIIYHFGNILILNKYILGLFIKIFSYFLFSITILFFFLNFNHNIILRKNHLYFYEYLVKILYLLLSNYLINFSFYSKIIEFNEKKKFNYINFFISISLFISVFSRSFFDNFNMYFVINYPLKSYYYLIFPFCERILVHSSSILLLFLFLTNTNEYLNEKNDNFDILTDSIYNFHE